MALGVHGASMVQRLPHEVEGCPAGPNCCWRWLARGALEQVSGCSTSQLGLPQMVSNLREELRFLRAEKDTATAERERAEAAEAAVVALKKELQAANKELDKLRGVQKACSKLEAEYWALEASDCQHQGAVKQLEAEVEKLRGEKEALREKEAESHTKQQVTSNRLKEAKSAHAELAKRIQEVVLDKVLLEQRQGDQDTARKKGKKARSGSPRKRGKPAKGLAS